jgi:hypothetical protein
MTFIADIANFLTSILTLILTTTLGNSLVQMFYTKASDSYDSARTLVDVYKHNDQFTSTAGGPLRDQYIGTISTKWEDTFGQISL